MRKTFSQRLIFLLLAVVMVVGLIPLTFAHAAVTDSPPTTETTPQEEKSLQMTGTEFRIPEPGIAPLALGDSHKVSASVTGVILGKSGYTYEYPDENGNLVTHTMDHITLWRAGSYYMYCLQPPVSTTGGYEGTEVDGSEAWANLTWRQQELVGLALLYGCPNRLDPTTKDDPWGHSIWMQGATQAIVWEIVLGYRDVGTFELTDTTIKDAFSGSPAFSQDGSSVDFRDGHGWMGIYYRELEAAIIRHLKYPSFTKPVQNTAPTIPLYPDGSGKFTATVTDTNGVLEDYTFTDGNGLTFQTSGNDLTITADASFTDTKLVAPTNSHIPNLETSVFILWQGNAGNSGGQVQVSVAEAGTDPVPVYFKAKIAVGTLKIVKDTNTGKDRSGWPFGVYTDQSCTSPVDGSPFTSGADGTIAASLAPRTYYVKELGSRPGWLMDTEVKQVTVQTGETATVTFSNVQLGNVRIVKTSEDGKVGGIPVRVQGEGFDQIFETHAETDEYGNEYGTFLAGNLLPGTYTVTEVLPEGSPYVQQPAQTVTVKAGETAEVKFHNVLLPGEITAKKTDPEGNPLPGAVFRLEYKAFDLWLPVEAGTGGKLGACTSAGLENGCLTTGEDGTVTFTGLYLLSTYRIVEVEAPAGYIKQEGSIFEGTLPTDTRSVTVTAVNHPAPGGIKIIKTSEDGVVAGLMFNIFDVAENGDLGNLVDDQFYTDENGVALIPELLPGWYEISELLPDDSPYIQPQKQIVEVKAGETTEVKFHNVLRPGEITAKKVDPMGNPLAGAKLLLEWSEDGTEWKPVTFSETMMIGGCSSEGLENGCLVSGEDGLISFTGLYPTLQYRLTEVKAPDGYQLLGDYAFVGSLPADTLTVTVEIVNMPVFMLPPTGSFQRIGMTLSGTGLCLAALLLGGCVYWESKKQQKKKLKCERN